MINDPGMLPFLHESNDEEAFINVECGQTDFLYAFFSNSMQKEYFITILELFDKYQLFLECAIPTAVLMMVEEFGVKVYNVTLCTSYDESRYNPKRLFKICEEDPKHDYDAYHPIKLSKADNWSKYFERIYHS